MVARQYAGTAFYLAQPHDDYYYYYYYYYYHHQYYMIWKMYFLPM